MSANTISEGEQKKIDKDDTKSFVFCIIHINLEYPGVIFIKEKPPSINRRMKMFWKLPGGAIKKTDTSPEEAIKREINEELGISHLPYEAKKINNFTKEGRIFHTFLLELILPPKIMEGLNEVNETKIFSFTEFLEREDDIFSPHFYLVKNLAEQKIFIF